ncbi:MAG: Biotin carboxyl carrier protein of acetyl-CoA carboxylase [Chlamydiae bacterium]|nr:Biotin carboxyl carrier protein of acetyl-CoA carboxylase [Chlamydiota bacterium]
MEMKQIKELMSSMEKAGIKKLRVKEEKGFELELERMDDGHHALPARNETAHHFAPHPAAHHRHPPHEETPAAETPAPGVYVTSPMVGTFYSAPSPDDPPYVKVGDQVDEETVICIIEAMKVMNEVKAGKKGKVAEILVSNAEALEFGTKLIRIE